MTHWIEQLKLAILAISIALLSKGCATGAIPKADVSWWDVNPTYNGLVRAQENKVMKCDSVEADNYLCLSKDDVRRLYGTYIFGCLQWREGFPKMNEAQMAEILKFIGKY